MLSKWNLLPHWWLVEVRREMGDNCDYHRFFVLFLYLFCHTFNTTQVFLFLFMQKLGQEYKLEKRDEKSENKEMIAAVYFKIQTFRDIKDLPIETTQ